MQYLPQHVVWVLELFALQQIWPRRAKALPPYRLEKARYYVQSPSLIGGSR